MPCYVIPGFLFADKGDRRIKSVSLSFDPPFLSRWLGPSVTPFDDEMAAEGRKEGEVEAAFGCIATSPLRPPDGRTRTDADDATLPAVLLSIVAAAAAAAISDTAQLSLRPPLLPPSLPPSLSQSRSLPRFLPSFLLSR